MGSESAVRTTPTLPNAMRTLMGCRWNQEAKSLCMAPKIVLKLVKKEIEMLIIAKA